MNRFVEMAFKKWNNMSQRTAVIYNDIICNIINVFNVAFDQFNAPLLNKSIN